MAKLSLANFPSCPPVQKIWNREYAAERLAAELAHLDRDSSYRFGVVMVEVAGFKRGLGSRLGYATTNQLWPRVLAFLTNDLGPEGSCSRLGEEEFLLILPGADAEKANHLADLLRRRWIETTADTDSLEVTVAAAAWVTRGGTIQAVFAVVDQALDDERQRKPVPVEADGDPRSDWDLLTARSRARLTGNS